MKQCKTAKIERTNSINTIKNLLDEFRNAVDVFPSTKKILTNFLILWDFTFYNSQQKKNFTKKITHL